MFEKKIEKILNFRSNKPGDVIPLENRSGKEPKM